MSSVNLSHHIQQPYYKSKVHSKPYSQLSFVLRPFRLLLELVRHGISYFKNKKIHHKTVKSSSEQKVHQTFSSTTPKPATPKPASPAIPTPKVVKATSAPAVQPMQDNIPVAYPLDLSGKKLKNQQQAIKAVLTEGHFQGTPYGKAKKIISPNYPLRKALRLASAQFPDTMSPGMLRANRDLNPDLVHILQMSRVGLIFGLKHDIDLPNGNIMNFEGSLEEVTLSMIISSYSSFYQQLDKAKMPDHLKWLTPERHQWISDQLSQLISSCMVDDNEVSAMAQMLSNKDFKGALASASGFNQHLTVNGFIGDIAYIANRGMYAHPPGVSFYTLPNRGLITDEVVGDIVRFGRKNQQNFFGHNAMVGQLGSKNFASVKMPAQPSGNCAYTSIEAYLQLLFAFQYLHSLDEANFYKNLKNPSMLKGAFEAVRPAFEQWVHYDRRLIYDDLLEEYNDTQSRPDSDREKMMYQFTLDYVHNSQAYAEMISYETT